MSESCYRITGGGNVDAIYNMYGWRMVKVEEEELRKQLWDVNKFSNPNIHRH